MTNLSVNLKNILKESQLPSNFCKESLKKVKTFIDSSISFTVVGMPALGISIFLRFLATQDFAFFIHIDINDLEKLDRRSFFSLLKRHQLQLEHKRIVLIFNRFDRLKKEFDQSFFANLRSIRDQDKEKIVMIFSANKPLADLVPEAISGGNLNMFSSTVFLPPYSSTDLLSLLALNSPNYLKHPQLKLALELSGGHYQLLQLLLKSDYLSSPLSDSAIRLQLKEIYQHLNYVQRKQIQKVAMGKHLTQIDPLLIDLGLIDKSTNQLFTPLFAEFVKINLRLKLPVQEAKLFRLLKERVGKIALKDEIFTVVWKDEPEGGSDWALNALIYRLRKNPTFISSGYVIESHKKVGYSLIKL